MVYRVGLFDITKKFIFISLFISVLTMLYGCSSVTKNTEEETIQIFQTKQETSVSESLPLQEESEWIDAYYKIIEKSGGTHIYLIDINADQIPELFFSYLGTSNFSIYHGYSFQHGNVLDIKIQDEFMPAQLELFKNRENGELVWLASGMFRDAATYSYIWYQIDFENFSCVNKTPFFEWREILEEPNAAIYQLREKDGTYQEMTKEEIDEYKKDLFSNYELQDNLIMFSFIEEFENRKDLFTSFAQLYDMITEENAIEDKSDFLHLPIYSIVNQNLYNHSQTGDIPVSCVRMGYTRYDEVNRADIQVEYIQLSRFLEENFKEELNAKLKQYAFSQWRVELEQGIELNIIQIPFVYKNYLSVQKQEDFYQEGSAHPWQNLSAVTFDLKTGQEVSLTEFVQVDDNLKAKIEDGLFICNKLTHEECIEMGFYDTLWNSILESCKTPYLSNNFYLKDGKFGFILDVPHSMGDYITFEIDLDNLDML